MDSNNWRPAQGGGEPTVMDTGDWRSQLQADSRQRIVDKIMETLKIHLPFSGQEGLQELKKIAVRFEEKIYTAATSQSDYLRKISLKMLTMEAKSQNTMANSLQPNSASISKNPPDPASGMQSQVNNLGQPLPIPMKTNQSQIHPQLSSQNIQNNITSTGVQGSASLTSALPPIGSLTQTTMPNVVGQNSSLRNIQNMPGVLQNSVGNSTGQEVPSNVFANTQRQMQGRQQEVVPQQQQQQSWNLQYYLYQQQLQHQLIKHKFQQGNVPQNLLQKQQSVIQPSVMQSSSLPDLQQNQQSSVQQSAHSVLEQSDLGQQQQHQQSPIIHQLQSPMQKKPIFPTQQQHQQPMGQQPNAKDMQQNQLIEQQDSILDMQLQQQQLMGQQNNLPNMHQQQLGPQSNVAGLQQQQQQMLGTQSGNSSMPTNQHSIHMLQQSKVPMQLQTQQTTVTLLPIQGPQSPQQPMMSQMQSQPGQLQQQLGFQQQSNPLQRDMQQRLQTSGPLLQQHNVIDQQKQLFQLQSAIPEASTSLEPAVQTGNANGGDWHEEVYQKIKTMKEMYLPELNEMYQKVDSKLQQHDSLPQQPKDVQLEMFKMFKIMLERLITFLQVTKSNIRPSYREKLSAYEKQIINFLNSNRPQKPVLSLQQGQQLPPPHMHSMQQSQQLQSQITLVPPQENQMNLQMQSMNFRGSVPTMQQNTMTSLQHNSLSYLTGISNVQQNMRNSLQPSSNLDPGEGTLNSLQQVAVGSLQQNPVSGPQQKEQQMQLTQQLKQQFQQHQMQQQLRQKLLLLQLQHQQQLQQQQQQRQLHQQPKQPQLAQLQAHQIPQLYQMTDVNDLKMRQPVGAISGVFEQLHSAGQHSAYHRQQLKSGAPFPISLPQLLQAASPQISHHPSPQIDPQNLLTSFTKTPMQSANSPLIVSYPSTPLATSPMPGESQKVNSGVSSFSNARSIGYQQTTAALTPAQSLAIGIPRISASPLLAEFNSLDGNHGNGSTIVSGKSSITEQPLEHLTKVVKSMSPKAVSASVGDSGSVASMIDRIAGSSPGNGSRAAIGEDLVAMKKCRLQEINFIPQDGTTGTRKMKCHTSAIPLYVVSSAGSINDSFKQLIGSEASDLESTATSSIQRPRIEICFLLVIFGIVLLFVIMALVA